MFYTSKDRDILDAYNEKVVAGENYDGTTTVRWADVIEHQDGGQWAIIKNPAYALIDGEEDAPTVDSIADFFSNLDELN
jgi:hypothetical protein